MLTLKKLEDLVNAEDAVKAAAAIVNNAAAEDAVKAAKNTDLFAIFAYKEIAAAVNKNVNIVLDCNYSKSNHILKNNEVVFKNYRIIFNGLYNAICYTSIKGGMPFYKVFLSRSKSIDYSGIAFIEKNKKEEYFFTADYSNIVKRLNDLTAVYSQAVKTAAAAKAEKAAAAKTAKSEKPKKAAAEKAEKPKSEKPKSGEKKQPKKNNKKTA